MKKLISVVLTLVLAVSMAVSVSAETNGETELTVTVPGETYMLNVPMDQSVEFLSSRTDIGNVTVTDAQNFATDKNIEVSVDYTPFKCETATTEIPYFIFAEGKEIYGNDKTQADGEERIFADLPIVFYGCSDGTVIEKGCMKNQHDRGVYDISSIEISVPNANWGKAEPGDYSSVITFTSKVVVKTE